MRIINDKNRIERVMKELGLADCFPETPSCIRICCYEKGELLISQIQGCNQLFFCVEGEAMLYRLNEDGTMAISTRILPGTGSMLGDTELLIENWGSCFVEAMTETYFLTIPFSFCREQMEVNVTFLKFMLMKLLLKNIERGRRLARGSSLTDRLMFYMRNMCDDHTLTNINRAAVTLQCSTRQLQRILKEQCDKGVLEKKGKGRYQFAEM